MLVQKLYGKFHCMSKSLIFTGSLGLITIRVQLDKAYHWLKRMIK